MIQEEKVIIVKNNKISISSKTFTIDYRGEYALFEYHNNLTFLVEVYDKIMTDVVIGIKKFTLCKITNIENIRTTVTFKESEFINNENAESYIRANTIKDFLNI